jgi:pyridoxal/pyridoxine/pyridoxamine kinase
MTRNILESNSQEAAKITRGIDGAKLSQVTQAVNEVISQTSKLSPEEIVQIQEKSTLRTLVDIAERVHRMGSLRRVLSPADYEKMLAI